MGKFKALPEYVQAVQFTNSPQNIADLHELANGKLEVDNSNVDDPILHIEITHLSFALRQGDWLICKNEEADKWTTQTDSDFLDRYESATDKWIKYPETKPENVDDYRVFGTRWKGTPSEITCQFKSTWNGDKFIIGMDEDITHFYDMGIIADPE